MIYCGSGGNGPNFPEFLLHRPTIAPQIREYLASFLHFLATIPVLGQPPSPTASLCSFGFVSRIHRKFYEQLPEHHRGLNRIDARIDGYIKDRGKERGAVNPLDSRAGKLLKALFLQGEVPRGEARSIMGMEDQSDRHARRIVSQLVSEGLVCSESHRAPLRMGFPTHVLRYYFPDLFDPSVLGEEKESVH